SFFRIFLKYTALILPVEMNDCFKGDVEEAIQTHLDILSEKSQFAVSLKQDKGLFNKISILHLTDID
ncbi:Uncharacterized protein APZ42_008038, partial [Daphnia magna]